MVLSDIFSIHIVKYKVHQREAFNFVCIGLLVSSFDLSSSPSCRNLSENINILHLFWLGVRFCYPAYWVVATPAYSYDDFETLLISKY